MSRECEVCGAVLEESEWMEFDDNGVMCSECAATLDMEYRRDQMIEAQVDEAIMRQHERGIE